MDLSLISTSVRAEGWFTARWPPEALRRSLRRLGRWEFWPPALFYFPVALRYLQLSFQYGGLAVPTLSNPGMHTGGIIGESKFHTLDSLYRACPDFVAETCLIPFDSPEGQQAALRSHNPEYPLVLKPNVGQRGFGFRIIHSAEEARAYFECFRCDTLLQRYSPGPREAGIFYYRFPNEEKGRIFAITEKIFPELCGDGTHTLEELIRLDPRASAIAGVYLTRFARQLRRVLAPGETFRLVEAGNHSQGAIFLDGHRLFSQALEARIDAISRQAPGFFVGRYDVRYSHDDALREGRSFTIIELNGASSEATSLYDPRNSLRDAYRILFRQWEIVFQIGAQNRRLGLRPTHLRTVLNSWNRYRRQVALHPVSD